MWLVLMLMSGYALASASSRSLLTFLLGSYQGTKLSGPSASLPSVLRYWSSYQPGPMLSTPIGDQRCLTSSRVIKIASLSRLTISSASAPVALAFDTSTDRSRAVGSYAIVSLIWYGMLNFGITAPMPFCIAVPNVSLTCMNTTVLGATPDASNTSFWFWKASARIIGAVGKLRNTNL